MKYIILLSAFLCSLSSYANISCSKNGTEIVYTNGVTTSKEDAYAAMKKIKDLELNSRIDLQGAVDYTLGYNYSEGVAKDFLEAAVQRIPKEYLRILNVTDPYAAFMPFFYLKDFQFLSFQIYLKSMEEQSYIFTNLLSKYLLKQKQDPMYIKTIGEIKKIYTDAHGRGKKVFAISHSQGGLFMKDVYDLLPENDNKTKYFAGFQIATPIASELNAHFGYATHNKDNLIGEIRLFIGALPANIVAPTDLRNGIEVQPNIEDTFKNTIIEYFLNHGISTTYLYDPSLKAQLITNLVQTAELMESNCPQAKIEVTNKSSFNVSFSSVDDNGLGQLNHVWDFGDGQTLESASSFIEHSYSKNGTYLVKLTVIDFYGNSNSITTQVIVGFDPGMTERSICATASIGLPDPYRFINFDITNAKYNIHENFTLTSRTNGECECHIIKVPNQIGPFDYINNREEFVTMILKVVNPSQETPITTTIIWAWGGMEPPAYSVYDYQYGNIGRYDFMSPITDLNRCSSLIYK